MTPITIWTGPPDLEGGFYAPQERSVQAEVFGKLAIHKCWNGTGFTVAHVPTGLAVERGLTYQQASALVILLHHLDWDWTDRSKADALRQPVAEAVSTVRST